MRSLFLLLFVVKVTIPFGGTYTYKNVKRVEPATTGVIYLTLDDGKQVLVPAMWTVVEQTK